MTKDGVRDFIAAEYTLSENYVHGLAAFGPKLKNFESPHSSRGSSPGLPAGNSVKSVVDMNAKIGSEDCTMLIRRVQEHGGKAAFCYYGCNHHGHHRSDFCIQDEVSLPIGWGVFARFINRINGI